MKKIVPLVLALILGLAAAYKAMDFGSGRPAGAAAAASRPQVVVAKQNIDAGELLTADMLVTQDVDSAPPAGTAFSAVSQVTGRVTTGAVAQGQPIQADMLAPPGAGPGLQAAVPPNMRAVTIEINEFSGLAGYLVPGCHVDLIQTMRDDSTQEDVSRVIMQDITIAEVGMRKAPDQSGTPPDSRSVTLLVTPRQAEVLELSSATGHPRLALRNGTDHSRTSTPGVALSELRGAGPSGYYTPGEGPAVVPAMHTTAAPGTAPPGPTASATPAPATRPDENVWDIQVIRGGVTSDVRLMLPPASSDASTAEMP